MNNPILSEDLNQAAVAIQSELALDSSAEFIKQANIGQNYYEYKHDILDNRIFYVDDKGVLREDKYASNVKIPHPFFTEQVDQKVQYLLSNDVLFNTDDDKLKIRLTEYIDSDFQLMLQDMVEGASIKGAEMVYARTTSEDKLKFEVSNILQTRPIYSNDNELLAILRYYERNIRKDKKMETIRYVERWTEKDVAFFVTDARGKLSIDDSQVINPRPHVTAKQNDDTYLGRSYGQIPFYKLSNNKVERSDLSPIKAIIDDYDLMNAFLSNNLQDFQDALYVVKGFKGDDLSVLRQNIKAKKTVSLPDNGGVDIKTVDIPIEARSTKLTIDRENIYKFGMSFDSSQVGDGNITNVVLKSRYALLDLKCNKTEVRLRSMFSWIIKFILEDIQRRYNESYQESDIEIVITRETTVNETDIVTNKMNEATALATIMQSIIAAAPYIGDESTLRLICEQFELDFTEVQKQIEAQDYKSSLIKKTQTTEV